MGTSYPVTDWKARYPTLTYVAPFVCFVVMLAGFGQLPLDPAWDGPIRVPLLAIVCWLCWPRDVELRPRFTSLSVLVGIIVFVVWIAPDLLVPGYRSLPLFHNSITGRVHSSLAPDAVRSPWILTWRTLRAVIIVPIVEELFWRGWLMRWLIDSDFESVPLGAYTSLAFGVSALLFASEHGPYWDVGLIAGAIYNWWIMRTRSLGDCILAHAVTNACLSAYTIAAGQWQYWQ